MPQPPKRLTPSNSPLDLFGSEVRRYRVLANYSIKQLANKIPYSASFVGAVERAESHCERSFAEYCDAELDTKQALSHLHDGLFGNKKDAFPEWSGRVMRLTCMGAVSQVTQKPAVPSLFR